MARNTVIDDLWHRTSVEGDDRRATGHGLDHRERERRRPVNGEQEYERIAQKRCLSGLVDLADEFYTLAKQRSLRSGDRTIDAPIWRNLSPRTTNIRPLGPNSA